MNERAVFSRGQKVSVYDAVVRRWMRGVVLGAHGASLHVGTVGHVRCVRRALVRPLYLVEAHP